jgi:hypothetical protein
MEVMEYHIAYFEELYGEGGFYDSIERKDISATNCNVGVNLLGEVYSASKYRRRSPNIITDSPTFRDNVTGIFDVISAHYQICPPSQILNFHNCLLYDNVIYQQSDGKNSPFYTTYRLIDRPYVKLLDDCPEKPVRIISNRRRRLFYLGSAGSFNYGHWLVDDLPRIKFLMQNPWPTTILMPSWGPQEKSSPSFLSAFTGARAKEKTPIDIIRQQTLAFLLKGMDIRIEFFKSDDILEISNLNYVTPCSFHPFVKNDTALRYINDQVRKRLRPAKKSASRIFVTRRANRGRVLRNQNEVEALLVSFGFVVVDTEAMTFAEQAHTFANADLIVGIMCAAMCNTLFSKSNARIIYLAPDEWVEPFYWDLASALGQEYTALHGPRAFENERAHLDDFNINIRELRTLIENIP